MSDEPGRRFTPAQMQAIMARAARRQERERAAEAERAGGFSLEELEQIAASAGIDPDHVAAAVGEVGAGAEQGRTVVGAPVFVERVRRLPGTVSDEAWARIVGELRRAFKEDGMAGQVGRVREWSAVGRGARRDLTTRLAVEPDGDGSRVTLHQSAREAVFAFNLAGGLTAFMAVLFTALWAAGADPELWVASLLLTLMTALFLGGVQVGSRIWARRQEEKFERVLDRIELVARDDARAPHARDGRPRAAAPAGASPAAPVQGSIVLDEEADEAPDVADATRLRTPRTHS